MASEDGSLLFKTATPVERDFYQLVFADDRFAALRPFLPQFYGTLKLHGRLKAPGGDLQTLGNEDLAPPDDDDASDEYAPPLRIIDQRVFTPACYSKGSSAGKPR